MKVLLDVNVLADLFLKREEWLTDAVAIWEANRTGLLSTSTNRESLPESSPGRFMPMFHRRLGVAAHGTDPTPNPDSV